MQDFSKEEFSLLGGSVISGDKDSHSAAHLINSGSQSQHFNPHVHHNHHPAFHHHHNSVISENDPSSIDGSPAVVVDEIKLSQSSDLIEASDSNKLEEVDRDLYPWSTNNIGSQFL